MPRLLPDSRPLYWFELRRQWRKRGLLAGLVGCALFGVAAVIFLVRVNAAWGLWVDAASDSPYYAIWVATTLVQMLLFLLLCPALTIEAMAGEYERGTLDHLLLTPLTSDDIVWHKYWAMLTPPLLLLLLVTVGLSVLAALDDTLNGLYLLIGQSFALVSLIGSGSAGLKAAFQTSNRYMALARAYGGLLFVPVLLLACVVLQFIFYSVAFFFYVLVLLGLFFWPVWMLYTGVSGPEHCTYLLDQQRGVILKEGG